MVPTVSPCLSRRGPATGHRTRAPPSREAGRSKDGCGVVWRRHRTWACVRMVDRCRDRVLALQIRFVSPSPSDDSHPAAHAEYAVRCIASCSSATGQRCYAGDECGRMQVTARRATQQQQMTAALSARLTLITTVLRRRDEVVRLAVASTAVIHAYFECCCHCDGRSIDNHPGILPDVPDSQHSAPS